MSRRKRRRKCIRAYRKYLEDLCPVWVTRRSGTPRKEMKKEARADTREIKRAIDTAWFLRGYSK
jgi:hypothetical protein